MSKDPAVHSTTMHSSDLGFGGPHLPMGIGLVCKVDLRAGHCVAAQNEHPARIPSCTFPKLDGTAKWNRGTLRDLTEL